MIQWYLVHVQHFILIPGTSPYSITEEDQPLADDKFTVSEKGETVMGNASYTIVSCKLSGISPLSSKLVDMVLLCCPTIVLLHGELCVGWIRRPGPAILLIYRGVVILA